MPVGPHVRGIAQAEQVQGKELSYNNLNDASAALELAAEFRDGAPTMVIVKHANPCGVATRDTLVDAWNEALACDSVSAFGGIIAVNRPLDGRPPRRSPASSPRWWSRPMPTRLPGRSSPKKKNLRLLLTGDLPRPRTAVPDHADHRRRAAGSGRATTADRHAGYAQDRDQARARRSRKSATACSPGPSPSTSSPTRSSMPRTARPPASARAR